MEGEQESEQREEFARQREQLGEGTHKGREEVWVHLRALSTWARLGAALR